MISGQYCYITHLFSDKSLCVFAILLPSTFQRLTSKNVFNKYFTKILIFCKNCISLNTLFYTCYLVFPAVFTVITTMIFKLIFTVFIALIFNIYIKLSYNIGTFVNISINISIKFFVSIFRIFCVFMLVCLFFFVAIILLLGISVSVLNVSCFHFTNFNPIQNGPFQSCSRMGRGGFLP